MRGLAALLMFVASAAAAEPARLALDGAFEQGGLVRGQAEPGAQATLEQKPLRVAPDGRFIFGFGRDAPGTATLVVTHADGTREERGLEVAPRHYEVQRIDGLPPQQVTPDPATLARIEREAALIKKARARDSDLPFFAAPFRWPVLGPISGVYGSQRILNGEPRQPHYGVDIAAPRGTPILAPAGGVVTLAEDDLFFTGCTIIIDHGYGLSTIYQHMDSRDVAVGQRIEAGMRIGTVGATGRVTGPHLHWGMNWHEVRLDPALVAGPMPSE